MKARVPVESRGKDTALPLAVNDNRHALIFLSKGIHREPRGQPLLLIERCRGASDSAQAAMSVDTHRRESVHPARGKLPNRSTAANCCHCIGAVGPSDWTLRKYCKGR